MFRRDRQHVPDPLVRDRVARVLTRPRVGGWLPPPDAQDVSWAPRHAAPAAAVPYALADALPAEARPAEAPPAQERPPALEWRGARLAPDRRAAAALVAVVVAAALVAAGVALSQRPRQLAVPAVVDTLAPEPAGPAAEIVIAVAGDVVRPGLVRLPPGSRVDDAVRAAGGLVPGASVGLLNLARPLVDGEQVVVGAETAQGSKTTADGRVSLNLADASDLDALPGIGPVLAERIVAWREENGPFASVDQLREVPGIGEAKFASLKAEVTL